MLIKNNTTRPIISIIIPTKNGSLYLEESLKGIRSQNINNIEIIVVDDGSDDNSREVAEKFDCTIIHNKTSQGYIISKNMALKIAKGKYIMFHDHDDIMNQNSLSIMLKKIEADTSIFAVMAKVKDFYSPDLTKKEREKIAININPYFGLFTGAILIKKEVFDIIGMFNESIKTGEIIWWNNEMRKNNLSIKKLEFISVNKRIHASNLGRFSKQAKSTDYATALRENIQSLLTKK